MSPTPWFNPFTKAPGNYEELLERYGHVVITTRVNLKNKRRVCFTLKDVEQERRASVYLRKNVRNEPWGVTCDSGCLISPPLPFLRVIELERAIQPEGIASFALSPLNKEKALDRLFPDCYVTGA